MNSDKVRSITDMLYDIFSRDSDSVKSLSELSKKTMVSSMTYVEDTLIQDEIMVPLMGTLNQIYLSYVLTALHIYNSVDRYTVVSNIIGRISNEDLAVTTVSDIVAMINNEFGKVNVSTEAYENIKGLTLEDAVKHLAVGRLIEFDFKIESGVDKNGKPVTTSTIVPILVQLRPILMASQVASAIITLNFKASLRKRWKQVKAGEIAFFRDFIGAMDLTRKHDKALRKDTGNVLSKFYSKKNKSQGKYIDSIVNGKNKNNLASSILIFSKDTFEAATIEASLNFDKISDRNKFFNEAYAIMVVVVDPMYDMIDIYYNGIDSYSELPYSAIKQANSKSGIDLKEMMAAIAKGSAPKF